MGPRVDLEGEERRGVESDLRYKMKALVSHLYSYTGDRNIPS